MPKPNKKKSQIIIKKGDKVGRSDATMDEEYLYDCFVDNGQLANLTDCHRPECVLVGRTGSGKSALLLMIKEKEEHVVHLDPHSLALQYLENSPILPILEQEGIRLDPFYKLLWRHILCIELIQMKLSQPDRSSFWANMKSYFGGESPRDTAEAYLRKYEGQFWKETVENIKEVTRELEDSVQAIMQQGASPQASAGVFKLGITANDTKQFLEKMSSKEKIEVLRRVQEVVSKIQTRELGAVLKILKVELFKDDQPRFYITVDGLDEEWVDNQFRNSLIRSLIDTAKEFYPFRSVKIIIALRTDLKDRVLSFYETHGAQLEKYDDIISPLKWSQKELSSLLDRRVAHLLRHQYKTEPVTIRSLFESKTIDGEDVESFITSRTLYRPRDAIDFMNTCIEVATDVGAGLITRSHVIEAEARYSIKRRRSIEDEWKISCPCLRYFIDVLKGSRRSVHIRDIPDEKFKEAALSIATNHEHGGDPLYSSASECFEANGRHYPFIAAVVRWLYKVGVVGVKMESHTRTQVSHDDRPELEGNIDDSTLLTIHPMFYRALNVNPKT